MLIVKGVRDGKTRRIWPWAVLTFATFAFAVGGIVLSEPLIAHADTREEGEMWASVVEYGILVGLPVGLIAITLLAARIRERSERSMRL